MSYIKGSHRSQGLLLPQTIDDYVAENNAVRAIAAFLERLDFVKLEFVRAEAAGCAHRENLRANVIGTWK
jgi:transposase